MECNLQDLGKKFDPTKQWHDYLKHYSTHLRDKRHNIKKILEIGVQTNKSVNMWAEYFPNATIYGMDVNPACQAFENDRIKILIGDQGKEVDLKNALQKIGGELDLVIDDGSHLPPHQILTFQHLYPALSTHGVYVLEDTGPCVGDVGLQTIQHLLPLIADINYWPVGNDASLNESYKGPFPPGATWTQRNTVGIAFYRWIVFILRGRNPEDNPFVHPELHGK